MVQLEKVSWSLRVPLKKWVRGLLRRIVSEKKNLTFADYMDGIVYLAFTPEPVTVAPVFITDERVKQAKREGWIPAIPEITVQWIMQRADQFKKSVIPSPQRSQ